MNNNLILVDLFDNPIGEASKVAAHSSPILHRAFSVFLYHDDQILIQQRALNKYHSGGLWANTCCSHPRIGEDTLESAKKRLPEETGIVTESLERIFSFTYMAQFANGVYEYEYDHVFIGEYRGEFSANPSEVEKMCWVKVSWLVEDMLKHPALYAPWFIICAPKVIEIISARA